jgi:gamma-glutamyltranspeptidase / glutathione hydrolase
MLMPLRACALAAAVAAAALLLGSATAMMPASTGVRARAGTQLPKRAVAAGTGGAVASDDVEATSAGLEVLRDGGNAVDAAVAVAAVLGVTDPFVGGIGGGG